MERLLAPEPEGEKKKGKKKKKTEGMPKKKWSRKRKLIAAAAAVLVLFAAGKMLLGNNKEVTPFVATQVLETGSIQNRLAITGPISGTDSVDVVSNLHAEVMELRVKEGDRVEKDQILAVVDSSDLEKEVEIAQNAYNLAVATKNEQQKQAEQGFAKAMQDCQAAKRALDRTAVMVQAGSEPPVNLEQAQNTYADAVRQVNSFTLVNGKPAANESYDLQIKNAEFELETKKEALESAQIKSPIAGTVVRVNTKVGQFADKPENEKPMFIIENLDQLELEIKVSEYSIGKVAVGQPVTIHADILNGKEVSGVVASISPTGEEKGNGSTERVIPTIVAITDPDTRLIAGITARAEIVLEEAEDTLVIPISALLQKEDGSLYVQKVENQILTWIPVETGVESDINIEIIPVDQDSLKAGDSIAINASAMLEDGTSVLSNAAN
ncbi:MAG: efflux RND transporter periplasmic adaptor subunit [Lachnospiraceae bacterium]|nr:efflux RND transporter periplasmic adaptor subunit [Lachnospiraceae bacterium]